MSKPKTTTYSIITEGFEEATNTTTGMPGIISGYIEDLDGFPDGEERQCLKNIDIWVEHFWDTLNQSDESRTAFFCADIFVEFDGGDDSAIYDVAFEQLRRQNKCTCTHPSCPCRETKQEQVPVPIQEADTEEDKEYNRELEKIAQIQQMVIDYRKEHPDYNPKNYNQGLVRKMAFRFELDDTVSTIVRGWTGDTIESSRLSSIEAREQFRNVIKYCIKYGFYTFEFIYFFQLDNTQIETPFPRFFDKALKVESWQPKRSHKALAIAYYYVPEIFIQQIWKSKKQNYVYGRQCVMGLEPGSKYFVKQLHSNFKNQITTLTKGLCRIRS